MNTAQANSRNQTRVRSGSQRGVVSLIVTMIMMIVISMIILGFAQVSRREQRQSLDRQLSTQAFFAAESGVNDAIEGIRKARAAGAENFDKPDCSYPGSMTAFYGNGNEAVLDAASDVRYTCMVVSTGSRTVSKIVTPDGRGQTVPLHPDPAAGGSFDTLNIRVTLPASPTSAQLNADCKGTLPGSGQFEKSTAWSCPYGVLRLDIVPTDSVRRTDLNTNLKAFFIYPTRSGPAVFDINGNDGRVGTMACTTSACNLRLAGFAANTKYALRAKAIYKQSNLEISATSGGSPVTLKGAQATIDVTGKAQDVLRRIQVRVALNTMGEGPDYAIVSGSSICKRFGVAPGMFVSDRPIGQDPANPLCAQQTVVPAAP